MPRRRSRLRAAIVLAGALVLAWPGAASTADGGRTADATFSEEDLRAFAAAAVKVFEIEQRFVDRIAAARTERGRQAIREQGVAEIVDAVEAVGLTHDSYNEILRRLRADDRLARQIARYVNAPPSPD